MTTEAYSRVTSANDIPSARFYVLATDKFMSAWGPPAELGVPNVLIVPCNSLELAHKIERIFRGRGEMIRVRVTGAKPRQLSRWFAQVKDADKVSTWKMDTDA